MGTTSNPIPRMKKTSNAPLYWGVAILAAIVIVLAILMKPVRAAGPTTDPNITIGGIYDTTSRTN